jgi:hypothetical protein
MATTKRSLATLIIENKLGGPVESWQKFDPRELYQYIESARNTLMDQLLMQGGALDGEFVAVFKNVPVECDEDTGEFYSMMPSKVVSLSNRSGLKQVSPMKNQNDVFIKVDNSSAHVYSNLEAGKLLGQTSYHIEKRRIVYHNLPFSIKKVLVKMIGSIEAFHEDELLPIPASAEAQIINMVMQMTMEKKQTPVDRVNDQMPNV